MHTLKLFALIVALSIVPTRAEESLPKRFGKVIALTGKATATKPDGSSTEVKIGDELASGTTVRTENGTLDLFFRRIGMIVRAETNTVLSLDKLEIFMDEGKMAKRTELSLKDGSFLVCVRVLIPESKVIVRTPMMMFHVPGTGMGRYQFRADGTALVGKKSQLTLVADAGAAPVAVMPGQLFIPASTNATQANPAILEAFTKKMDVLQKTAAELTPPPLPEELP